MKVLILSFGIASGLLATGGVASAKPDHHGRGHGHSHHGHHRGHYDYHPGHYDYHPGHFDYHRNHYHYHPGHFDYHPGHYDFHRGHHGHHGSSWFGNRPYSPSPFGSYRPFTPGLTFGFGYRR